VTFEEPVAIDIEAFDVDGNTLLKPIEVEAAVYPFMGPGRIPADVDKARAALEPAYHAKGYQSVVVEIPPPRGVARVWLDRSLGRSRTPRALVQPTSHSVATDAAAAATRNQAAQQKNGNQSVTPPAWRWRSHRRPRRR
jgi:hypothetical protein